jgi:hypothetical protein
MDSYCRKNSFSTFGDLDRPLTGFQVNPWNQQVSDSRLVGAFQNLI